MSAARVCVDFAGGRRKLTAAGAVLLVLGAGAVAVTWVGYRSIEAQRAGLEMQLQALNGSTQRDPAQESRAVAVAEEVGRVTQQLSVPWTGLLAELEGASRDSGGQVALLSVEPDHDKHRVRITGESRDLAQVLGYVERLRSSALLRFPMLESHDVKTDDPQRPVRFAMTADWKELP
jgi:hypothetical protein